MEKQKPWADRSLFEELYYEKNLTMQKIADRWGCSANTVSEWRKKHNLPEKDHSVYHDYEWHDEELLRELYLEQRKSTIEIADMLGCSASTVRDHLNRNGIETRSRSEAFRKLHPSICTNSDGYIYAADSNNGDLVYLHRLLAVSEYGLEKIADKDIHHKNSIPWDNRPDNIEVISKRDHGSIHSNEYWSGA